jgi:hypothetical protein
MTNFMTKEIHDTYPENSATGCETKIIFMVQKQVKALI